MSARTAPPASILHVTSASDASAMQARCIRLISAMGGETEHALAVDGGERLPGTERLHKSIRLTSLSLPPLTGRPWPRRLNQLASAMSGHQLICTWGVGALDAVLAHTLFADLYKLPPLIHHEGEGNGPGRSTVFRRIALGRAAALVVPSRALEQVALDRWQQPRTRVRLIAEGIDTDAFAATPKRDAMPGLVKRRGEWWLGTISPPRPEALRPLMEAVRSLPEEWQLVVAGDTLPREAIVAEAERTGIEDRVHPTAMPSNPERLIGLFDLYAPSAAAPATANWLREAMAAGLPIVAPRDSAAAELVASENGPFLSAPGDEPAMLAAIASLAGDRALRHRIGEANRLRARAEYDERRMVERSLALWRGLLARS